jgi:hypothetical protein
MTNGHHPKQVIRTTTKAIATKPAKEGVRVRELARRAGVASPVPRKS